MFQKKIEGAIQVGTKSLRVVSLKKRKIKEVSSITYEDFYQGTASNMQINLSKLKIIKTLKRKKVALCLPLSEFTYDIQEFSSKLEKKLEDFEADIDEKNHENVPGYKSGDYEIESILLEENFDTKTRIFSYKILVLQIPRLLLNSYINALKYFEIDVVKLVPDFFSLLMLMDKLEELYILKNQEPIKKTLLQKLKDKNPNGVKVLSELEVEKVKCELIVDFNSIQTKILLRKDGELVDIQIINAGGFALTEAMMEEYMVDYKEAEAIKFKYMSFNKNSEESAFLRTFDVKNRIKGHTDRIKNMVSEYEEKYNIKIERIMFFGGISIVENFIDLMVEQIGVKSQHIDGAKYEEFYTSQRADIGPLLGLISDSID